MKPLSTPQSLMMTESVRVDPPHEEIARRLIDHGRRQPPIWAG
jgi:hypothetical protein